jgi:4-diphosphocytidyl-2-C-methyl-D-erythritol kinase
MDNLRVLAPAKVNLFLGIGKKREDGYHDALSILHALALHDTLSFIAVPKGAFAKGIMYDDGTYDLETWDEEGLSVGVEIQWREGMEPVEIPLRENLVAKAVMEFARACDFPWKGYLRISVEKHIPAQAGLGGGSSDAAAALVGCAELWGIGRDDPRLAEGARSLGADVAFFLQGGCGVYGDRGDVFERALDPRRDCVLLVIPEGGVSTGQAYRTFDDDPQPIPDDARTQAQNAQEASNVPIFNNLAAASESVLPVLVEVREWAQAAEGISDVLLSGSGSATFCVCDDMQTAFSLAVDARAKGWTTRVTSFSSLKAASLPRQQGTNIGATRV